MAEFKLGILTDVLDLFERLEAIVLITETQKTEIIESVSNAIQATEKEFGKRTDGTRNIGQNESVGDAWHKASVAIQKYLPKEKLAKSLRIKGEAWINMHKWSEEQLNNENIKIEEIYERLEKLTSTRRKFFRPND